MNLVKLNPSSELYNFIYFEKKSIEVQIKQLKDKIQELKGHFLHKKNVSFYSENYHILHAIPQCKKLLETHITFNFWNLCCNTTPIFF